MTQTTESGRSLTDDELDEKAIALAEELKRVPMKNELRAALRIGHDRATALMSRVFDNAEGDKAAEAAPKRVSVWPLVLLALPAFVAIWSGWVGLGEMAGFGIIHPLPGIADGFKMNTAITLPIGVEAYAAYALRVWLSGAVAGRARAFARNSAIVSLVVGCLGQVAYHILAAAGVGTAPWWITALVACLPVGVLGMGAGLAHLVRSEG